MMGLTRRTGSGFVRLGHARTLEQKIARAIRDDRASQQHERERAALEAQIEAGMALNRRVVLLQELSTNILLEAWGKVTAGTIEEADVELFGEKMLAVQEEVDLMASEGAPMATLTEAILRIRTDMHDMFTAAVGGANSVTPADDEFEEAHRLLVLAFSQAAAA